MSGHEHDGGPDPKFLALQVGTVVSNKDPRKLGRVQVKVPGVIEPNSAWAHPLGLPGSGGKQRGMFAPPPEGAEVGVMFAGGDVDRPYYFCGYPGEGETATEVQEATVEEAADKVVILYEDDRWKFALDHRDGKQRAGLVDKLTDYRMELDGKSGAAYVHAGTVLIEADTLMKLEGPMIQLGDRVVVPNGKPIT